MSGATERRTVVVEREMPFPQERIWRALTQPHLLQEWLLKSDFAPEVGRRFSFQAAIGAVDCQVLAVEPTSRLSYSWDAMGLESTVTFTLAPTDRGTRLRMEQHGFRPDQEQAFRGATAGWHGFLAKLETLLTDKGDDA